MKLLSFSSAASWFVKTLPKEKKEEKFVIEEEFENRLKNSQQRNHKKFFSFAFFTRTTKKNA